MALKAKITDTMLLHHLVSPDLPHDLEFLASVFTSKPEWKSTAGTAKERYNAIDVDVTAQIAPQLRAIARQLEVESIYENISIPISHICNLMHDIGLKVDPTRIKEIRERALGEQKSLEGLLPPQLQTTQLAVNKRLQAPPGYRSPKSGKPVKYMLVPSSETVVPWRSDKAVGEYLYTDQKLAVQKHIKTGKTTTDKYSLEKLYRQTGNKAIDAIRKLRSIDETLTTFAKADMQFITSIHPHFLVHGTNEGRLSSSGPNAQNIVGDLRVMYIPHKPNHYILQADFSSIENRLTAYLAEDRERAARFAQPGFSEHKWACEQFFGIPMAEVVKSTDAESPYQKAKHIVHGSNYGLGARKMSTMYGVPEREVKGLIAKWKAAIPRTTAWQERISQQARRDGYLTNPFGRKRFFYTSNWYTESLSYMPQSTAADMILRTMIALMYERINWPAAKVQELVGVYRPLPKAADLLVQVHDALVFQVEKSALDEVAAVVKLVMEQPFKELAGFSCPVAVEYGPSWGELEPYGMGGNIA